MPAERVTPNQNSNSDETNPMAEMLDQYLSCQQLDSGQIVSGTVVMVSPNEVIVDVGAKCEGIIPQKDLERLSTEEQQKIQVGAEILVYVINSGDSSDDIVLSITRAQAAQDWRDAQDLLNNQEAIELPVIGSNKGGLLVQYNHLRGFVPGSQITTIHNDSRQKENKLSWDDLIGQTLSLKVIEVDQDRNRLILSERAAMQEIKESRKENLFKTLSEGEIKQGRVTNLVDFGAFVDLGGIDGLIHLSEIAWRHVEHPSDILKVGQEIDVYVLSIDQEQQRIGLSLKRLRPDPWDIATEKYPEGQLVEATITNLTKWGAFARLVDDEAIEGLIHISELSNRKIAHPREVVQPGQTVTLRVIELDTDNHRLSLSMKQVDSAEFIGQDWETMLDESSETDTETTLSNALSEAMQSSQE